MIHCLSFLVKPSIPSFLYPFLIQWLLSEKRWYHLVTSFFNYLFFVIVKYIHYLSIPPNFSEVRVTRSLVLCVCVVAFGYCVVCSSSIYGFWLPLWYLQTLLTKHLHNKYKHNHIHICRAWTIISNIWFLIDKILTIYISQISFSKVVSAGDFAWHRMYLAFIEYLCLNWPRICSTCRNHFPDRSSCMIYHSVCN
jgi:hypothetical protein